VQTQTELTPEEKAERDRNLEYWRIRNEAVAAHEQEVRVWEAELITLSRSAGSVVVFERERVRKRLAHLYTTGPEGWK
jgi:hypothetical protein